MSELRTYINSTGVRGVDAVMSVQTVDASRQRINWRDSQGNLLASTIVTDAEFPLPISRGTNGKGAYTLLFALQNSYTPPPRTGAFSLLFS